MMRLALMIPLLLAPLAARAQPIDMTKGGPVEVTSRDGMEWHQEDQVIIAKGDAKAIRGNVTVTADQLMAYYRKKAGTGTVATNGTAAAPAASVQTPDTPAKPASASPPGPPGATSDTGDNEIYRLEAIGNVHIYTATDQAFGDKAVYDIDQAVLLMTGRNLHIITPQQTMSARDTMEYWSQKHMAVGRGNAVVNTNDGRRLSGDILVGYTDDTKSPGAAAPVQKVAATTAAKPPASNDPLADAGGKLKRVDAFGHVEVRTATEIFHADKGVYIPDTGIARLVGNVHLTRGQNQLNGDESVINLRTGISTMIRNPGQRVEGLVVPNDANGPKDAPGAPKPAAGTAKAGGPVK